MMDLVALRSLVAVARDGSVVSAAAGLGYTPSAISQQIKKLESHAGVALLERVGRGVVLTEPGRLLVERAEAILAQLEELTASVQAGQGRPTGRLRVAAFSTAVRGLVAEAVHDLGVAAPEVQVGLVEMDPWDALAAVAAGQVDLAVVHNWEPIPLNVPVHLRIRSLGTDIADVLVPHDHPLAGRRWVTAAALADQHWVSVPEGSICHQWLTTMLRSVGTEPRISHWSAEFASHVELVGHGVATALVPRLGRGPLPATVRALSVRDPVPTRTVSVAWRATMAESPALRTGLEILTRLGRTHLAHPAHRDRLPSAGPNTTATRKSGSTATK
ncbi:MAG: LysR family transcriptional regulator [Kineosporiaceae bacterium]|nr:LysR family transcriptional regulator [Kineosporiaceae bacterium]MBK8076203.1 LysR family transcriptional regulator [Kineosporiaceae bacterium]